MQTSVSGICWNKIHIAMQISVSGICWNETHITMHTSVSGICWNKIHVTKQTSVSGVCWNETHITMQTSVSGVCWNETHITMQTSVSGICWNETHITMQTSVSGVCWNEIHITMQTSVSGVCRNEIHITVQIFGIFFEEEDREQVDPLAVSSLDGEFEKFTNMESTSLLKKYLTQDVFDNIKQRSTAGGATLHDCIKSGLANPDSGIGLYAPDAESYACFKELFDPVIDEYHGGHSPDDIHPEVNFGDPAVLGDLNEWGDYVVSTRVRCARSIEGYPFNPLLTSDQYLQLEQDIGTALQTLEDDLVGVYQSLGDISPEEQEELLEKHLLFKQGDRFLEAAGACRFWPDGRGIFLNADNTLVIWVNEEDHLRIISMQEGGNLSEVYSRFVRAVTALGDKLPFSASEHLGFLSFCPTNLGTAIRASVHIRLPKLGEDIQTLEETANKYNLQVRGTSGEHSEAKDYVFDISNRRRLGITEIEALQEMYDGVKEIIQLEKSMEDGSDENRKSSSY
ncbi:arginine kinase-like [Palaemon carinicauda]|uniref:arginine kinase-like n=1 Tax=Palaemon carinicauda TaxID=392227 RepID=UPI0035B63372